jgi:hypothetical protein
MMMIASAFNVLKYTMFAVTIYLDLCTAIIAYSLSAVLAPSNIEHTFAVAPTKWCKGIFPFANVVAATLTCNIMSLCIRLEN